MENLENYLLDGEKFEEENVEAVIQDEDCDIYQDIDDDLGVNEKSSEAVPKNTLDSSLNEKLSEKVAKNNDDSSTNGSLNSFSSPLQISPDFSKGLELGPSEMCSTDDDVDIYDNIHEVHSQFVAEELAEKVKGLEERCKRAESKNEDLQKELDKVNQQNLALRKNISSLYKTASMELSRKDKQMKELQGQYDSMVFRRGFHRLPRKPRTDESGNEMIVTKESSSGKTIQIEDGTECTFRMGNTSVSFSAEHFDFKKSRVELIEANAYDTEEGEVSQPEQELYVEPFSQSQQTASQMKVANGRQQLEEGEVVEKSTDDSDPVEGTSASTSRPRKKHSPSSNSSSNSRQRESFRRQSPTIKRKRSPSADERRYKTRNRPDERSYYHRRARTCRSPPKSHETFNQRDAHRKPSRFYSTSKY